MQRQDQATADRRAVRLVACGLLIAGIAASAAGCTTAGNEVTNSIPPNYRERHPIALQEGRHTLVLFVGRGRGGLSPTQRAEVLAFARAWRHEATGGITVDRPAGSANERAANDTLKEALSIVVQAGVPNNGVGIRPYRAAGYKIAALRLSFPQMVAHAGPCGDWPDDLGPSFDRRHYENLEYWNFGCATQHNLAAMIDNPSDLVQPRAETPAYNAKRTFQLDKWRKGESPATVYQDNQKGAVSEVGK
jgi:pilus assembly protein CpaD